MKIYFLEQVNAGWRFWLFWVVMANIGFFSGLMMGGLVASFISDKLLQAAVTAIFIGLLTSLAQGIVLRRHQISGLGWTVATTAGWAIGILVAGLIIFNLDTSTATNDFFRWVVPAAFIAGAVVGIPQMFVLRQRWPHKSWQWIVISAFGWAIQVPGMLPGFFLARWIRPSDQIPH